MAPKTIIHSDNITSLSLFESAPLFVVHKPEKRNLFGKVVRKEGYYEVRPFTSPSSRYTFISESEPLPIFNVRITLKGSHDINIPFRGDASRHDAQLFMSDILGRMRRGERFVISFGGGDTTVYNITK